jgi:hypothetical protein
VNTGAAAGISAVPRGYRGRRRPRTEVRDGRRAADRLALVPAAAGDVRIFDVLLTHGHDDHTGSAAAPADRTGARVLGPTADAPVIEGERAPPPPDLADWEFPLHQLDRERPARIMRRRATQPEASPCCSRTMACSSPATRSPRSRASRSSASSTWTGRRPPRRSRGWRRSTWTSPASGTASRSSAAPGPARAGRRHALTPPRGAGDAAVASSDARGSRRPFANRGDPTVYGRNTTLKVPSSFFWNCS